MKNSTSPGTQITTQFSQPRWEHLKCSDRIWFEQTSFRQQPRWCCWRHCTHAGGMTRRNVALRLESHVIIYCYLLSSFQRLSRVRIPASFPQLTAILQHFKEDQSQMATGPTSWTTSVLLHINRVCFYLQNKWEGRAFSKYTGKRHFVCGTKSSN